ncbi:cytochrome b/b6 domain-containing protein [Lacibacterium aquatile]|uniref:Cytochrome b/b6 domain-containing protein n=1 Tax=Lacibacterium aquatile TaxID=1168082 RepID=A0ABW5DWS5_9PROT
MKKTPLVWDLPTRLFHWALAILILMAWVTAEIQENLERHALVGQAILTLVLFRILWGFVGGRHARFTDFIKHPRAAFQHLNELRGPNPTHDAGHNAAGGWMVVALLGLIGLQATTGLFMSDGVLFDAPLYDRVGEATAKLMGRIHRLNFTVIEIAVLAHILAVFTYLIWKRQNLIGAMVTGRKKGIDEATLTPLEDRAPALWRALICLAVAFGVVRSIFVWG